MSPRHFNQKRWLSRGKDIGKDLWHGGPGQIELLCLGGSMILFYLSLQPHPRIHTVLSWLILPLVIYSGGFYLTTVLLPAFLDKPPIEEIHFMYRRYAILLELLYLTVLVGFLLIQTPF